MEPVREQPVLVAPFLRHHANGVGHGVEPAQAVVPPARDPVVGAGRDALADAADLAHAGRGKVVGPRFDSTRKVAGQNHDGLWQPRAYFFAKSHHARPTRTMTTAANRKTRPRLVPVPCDSSVSSLAPPWASMSAVMPRSSEANAAADCGRDSGLGATARSTMSSSSGWT